MAAGHAGNPAKRCGLHLTKEAFKRCIERRFPISKLKRMVYGGVWCPHVIEDRRTCVYRDPDDGCHWTLIIAPKARVIFIITVYKSNYREIEDYKRSKAKVQER
ncbi:MAG: hypothetical protein NT016_00585 [Candidatus Aenigmarchaeota archaeon]|nr:hypothetical protein [Candidatus Aenigmarchaeota archaeon]